MKVIVKYGLALNVLKLGASEAHKPHRLCHNNVTNTVNNNNTVINTT